MGDNSPYVSHLVSRGTDCLCSEPSFQRCVHREEPWKIGVVSLQEQRAGRWAAQDDKDNACLEQRSGRFTAHYKRTECLKFGVPLHELLHWMCKYRLALCASPCENWGSGNWCKCWLWLLLLQCYLWLWSLVSSANIHKTMQTNLLACKWVKIKDPHSSWQNLNLLFSKNLINFPQHNEFNHFFSDLLFWLYHKNTCFYFIPLLSVPFP